MRLSTTVRVKIAKGGELFFTSVKGRRKEPAFKGSYAGRSTGNHPILRMNIVIGIAADSQEKELEGHCCSL
jgi:hypothetical protein